MLVGVGLQNTFNQREPFSSYEWQMLIGSLQLNSLIFLPCTIRKMAFNSSLFQIDKNANMTVVIKFPVFPPPT